MPPQGQIEVHAKSFESVAVETTSLRFPPPLAERSSNPEGFEYWWKMMEFVFALPAPETFPPYPAPPRQKEREILERFISVAGELAESTLLNSSDGVTVHVPDEENEAERVETSFPARRPHGGLLSCSGRFTRGRKATPHDFNASGRS